MFNSKVFQVSINFRMKDGSSKQPIIEKSRYSKMIL